MIKDQIQKLIKKAIKELQKEKKLPKFDISEITIEYPREKAFGDYACNVAMQIAKQAKKSPLDVAKSLVTKLLDYSIAKLLFSKVEAVKPGFINFTLKPEWLAEQISEILKSGDDFGKINIGKGKKVQVEFISANPTGPLTMGNGRGAFTGDSLASVLKKAGFKVQREYYWNDSIQSSLILGLGESIKGITKVYGGPYIKKLPEKIKKKYKKNVKDLTVEQISRYASEIIKKEIKEVIEKKLKIKFDNWFSEQKLYDKKEIDKALVFLKKKRLVCYKERACWFKSTKYGDTEDRVLIRADGKPTYFLDDIAYLRDKFKRGFDKVIDIWGADHAGYVQRMQGAVEALGHKGKLDTLICQLVRLIKSGKVLRMSKRKGIYITLEELVDEVGLDVARFFFLQHSLDTHMDFDLDLAKERSEKNPVFYVQYAHARISSILRKAKTGPKLSIINYQLLKHPAELDLICQLIKFPEIIEDAAKDYGVHRLPYYTLKLAASFHDFYEKCRVISDDKELTQARLALVQATKIVLKNVLGVMGISAPEKM